jgi:hypothetical protein
MHKEWIGPRLRELGFRGSGGVYTRPDSRNFVRIGFQKSVYGTKQQVKFTLNVSVINKAQWEAARAEQDHLPVEPSANTFYGGAFWQQRISELMPRQDRERWWELSPTSDIEAVAADVLKVIEEIGLPAMDKVADGDP